MASLGIPGTVAKSQCTTGSGCVSSHQSSWAPRYTHIRSLKFLLGPLGLVMALHSLWDTLLCFLQTCSLLLCGRRQAPAHTFPSAASKTPFNLSSSILPAEEQCPSVQARTVFLSYISRTLSQARMSFLSPRNTSATATADDSLVSAELGQSPLSKTRLDFLFSTTVSRTQQHSTTGGLGSPLSVSSSSPLNRSFLPVSPILPVTPTSAVERSMQHAETDFSIAVLPGPT